jgi:hypothetical protein
MTVEPAAPAPMAIASAKCAPDAACGFESRDRHVLHPRSHEALAARTRAHYDYPMLASAQPEREVLR